MNDHRTEHDWFEQAVAAYLADGLDSVERDRFEAHAQACAECAERLADLRSFDQSTMELFETDRPAFDLDDRIIDRIHTSRRGLLMYIHPSIRKAATSVAAVLALGIMGAVAGDIVQPGSAGIAKEIALFSQSDTAGADGRLGRAAGNSWYAAPSELVTTGTLPSDEQMPVSQTTMSPAAEQPTDKMWRLGESTDARMGLDRAIGNREVGDSSRRGLSSDSLASDVQRNDFNTQFQDQLNAAAEKRFLADRHLERSPEKSESPASEPMVTEAVTVDRKVIRNGEMSFEVEAFGPAADRINVIVAQHGGYVSTTNSEKLPNGKTRGTIVVRVNPDRLDALLVDLKAIGELRSQQITAQDVTKKYTDLQSQLRAARAMEERLLEMIRSGKGELKDILAAEQQLGVTREKIEVAEGEIRYYDSLVALSTLTITLAEKDIQAAATVTETMHIDLRLRSNDTGQLRADTLELIEQAGGQVTDAQYEQASNGTDRGTITAILPADAEETIIHDLGELAMIDSLSRQARRATSDGSPVRPGVKVDRRDVQMVIYLTSGASVAPAETIHIQAAVHDVAQVYVELLAQAQAVKGHVGNAQISEREAGNVTGNVTIDLPADRRDLVAVLVSGQGAILSQTTQRSQEAGASDSRVRFQVGLLQVDQIAPRETTDISIETSDVAAQRESLLALAERHGRVLASTIETHTSGESVARLTFDVPLTQAHELLAQVKSAGRVQSRATKVNEHTPVNDVTRARFSVVLTSNRLLVAKDDGFWASVRDGLAVSVAGLLWSLRLVVIGLCFVLPWVLIVWLATRWLKRGRRDQAQAVGR